MEHVSREVGVSAATLERWRAEALADVSGDRTGLGSQRWTAVARLHAVITTAAMAWAVKRTKATRSAWCREHGLYPAELDSWKQDAIAGLGEPRAASAAEARQDRRRVKELERELHRKDKALAETAALLVLSKKTSSDRRPACGGRNGSRYVIPRGERPDSFWWTCPRQKTWPMSRCGLADGDAFERSRLGN